jgi:uncharacterized protein YcfJ
MSTFMRSTLIAAFALSAFAATASAQNRSYNQGPNQGQSYDFARVIHSQPIYETVEIDDGREVCRNEQVRTPQYSQHYDRPRSESASIFGAIIGGVIGNQFGHGRGRAAATVAGVALGSAIANDSQRQDRYRGRYERSIVSTERVCSYEPRVRTERQLVGYNVRYDYKGQIGETTTRNQPGSTIRVAVAVTAIED